MRNLAPIATLLATGINLGCKVGPEDASSSFERERLRMPELALADVAPLAGHTDISGLPPRQSDSLTGSEFLEKTAGLAPELREEAIYAEIRRGNVPSFLRRLAPVRVEGKGTDGRPLGATIYVMPDYLAIGSDTDWVRMPMNLMTAARLADELGFALPTRKMVNAIHESAAIRTPPLPLAPSGDMASNEYYARHNSMIDRALGTYAPGQLISGQKKDVVMNEGLRDRPDRIFIYGWLRPDGKPLQPLSDVHDAKYADYSHGIRLISRSVMIEGQMDYLPRAIGDAELGRIFAYDGPLPDYQELLTRQALKNASVALRRQAVP